MIKLSPKQDAVLSRTADPRLSALQVTVRFSATYPTLQAASHVSPGNNVVRHVPKVPLTGAITVSHSTAQPKEKRKN